VRRVDLKRSVGKRLRARWLDRRYLLGDEVDDAGSTRIADVEAVKRRRALDDIDAQSHFLQSVLNVASDKSHFDFVAP